LFVEVTREQTIALIFPDQTTGFDHEAFDIVGNYGRYPSHCCNHRAVVALTSGPKPGQWTNSTDRIAFTEYGRGNG
jgi:hypothetical protein